MKDKRAQFFLLAALLCLSLVPLADDRFRTLTVCVGATYVALAVASFLDHRGKQ